MIQLLIGILNDVKLLRDEGECSHNSESHVLFAVGIFLNSIYTLTFVRERQEWNQIAISEVKLLLYSPIISWLILRLLYCG